VTTVLLGEWVQCDTVLLGEWVQGDNCAAG